MILHISNPPAMLRRREVIDFLSYAFLERNEMRNRLQGDGLCERRGKLVLSAFYQMLASNLANRRLFRPTSRAPTTPLWARGATPCEGSRSLDSFLPRSEEASTGFMVAPCGVLSEEYGYGEPGVCLSDGQTKGVGVPPQGGRGDPLLQRMPPYLT